MNKTNEFLKFVKLLATDVIPRLLTLAAWVPISQDNYACATAILAMAIAMRLMR